MGDPPGADLRRQCPAALAACMLGRGLALGDVHAWSAARSSCAVSARPGPATGHGAMLHRATPHPTRACQVDLFIELGDIMPWTFACIAADTKEGVEKAKAEIVTGLKARGSVMRGHPAGREIRRVGDLAVQQHPLRRASRALLRPAQNTETLLNRLGSTEGGNYFLGGEYTLADVAHSTPYFRTINVLKPARGIDINALIKEHGLDR